MEEKMSIDDFMEAIRTLQLKCEQKTKGKSFDLFEKDKKTDDVLKNSLALYFRTGKLPRLTPQQTYLLGKKLFFGAEAMLQTALRFPLLELDQERIDHLIGWIFDHWYHFAEEMKTPWLYSPEQQLFVRLYYANVYMDQLGVDLFPSAE